MGILEKAPLSAVAVASPYRCGEQAGTFSCLWAPSRIAFTERSDVSQSPDEGVRNQPAAAVDSFRAAARTSL